MTPAAPPTSRFPVGSTLYQLVETRLGRNPIDYIRERRERTPPMAWARIADEIKTFCNRNVKTDEQRVYLTHEALRRWSMQADEFDRAAERAEWLRLGGKGAAPE